MLNSGVDDKANSVLFRIELINFEFRNLQAKWLRKRVHIFLGYTTYILCIYNDERLNNWCDLMNRNNQDSFRNRTRWIHRTSVCLIKHRQNSPPHQRKTCRLVRTKKLYDYSNCNYGVRVLWDNRFIKSRHGTIRIDVLSKT